MTIPANLDVYISAVMFVLGAYFIALYIGLVVWTSRDIHGRSRDVLAQILATLLVALFTVPGLFIYLLLRPHETLSQRYERELAEEALLLDLDEQRVCPECQRQVEPDFVVCPYCHHQLHLRCVGCGRLLQPAWDVCPYCGLVRGESLATEEEAPATAEVADEPAALPVAEATSES
ncbi:MAG: zinc ribbon domain-containing protein [Chloroflexota bacterium]